MKILLTIASWCLLVYSGWSQNTDTLNRSDENGKQGHWIYYGKDRPDSGIPPEGKVEEGNYVNDRKEGTWIKYHNDGVTPKIKGQYKNNRPDGNYIKYDQYGQVRDSGNFNDNQYSERGKKLGWYPNEYEVTYNSNGKPEGTVTYYYPNRQVEFTYTAKNGIPCGKAYRYYENGDLKEMITYDEEGNVIYSESFAMKNPPFVGPTSQNVSEKAPSVGSSPRTRGIKWQPNGYNKVYNEDDEIWQEGVFNAGKLHDGKLYVYDLDGILLKVNIFKNGYYHSDGQL